MSARPGFITTVRQPADGGVSPNAFVPQITVEVRCFWPPKATDDEVISAIGRAAGRALVDYRKRREEWEQRYGEKRWLQQAASEESSSDEE